MTQKKSYSRYFIILQEDEKGYALASDKLPSGYAKLEIKNDKCKVSYYVQNLKKESAPYHMVLICNKKDAKKLLRLGELNIDEHGRAEVFHEYAVENVANCGVNVDKIVGASIVRMMNSNIIPVMSGFASTDIPDWKGFPIIEEEKKRQDEERLDKTMQPAKVEQPKAEPMTSETPTMEEEPITEGTQEPANIFDEYEMKIEVEKDQKSFEPIKKTMKEQLSNNAQLNRKNNEGIDIEDGRHKKECKENKQHENKKHEECKENKQHENKKHEECKENEQHENKKHEECKENKHHENEKHEESKENKHCDNVKAEEYKENKHYDNKKHDECKKDCPKGSVGTFFMSVADGFEELENVCCEIKRCRWYKIPINSPQDMNNCLDYNKYTVAYYPMMNYYQYIVKFGHFILGYKLDKENKMKYIVYGIPGRKSRADQPFGGRSGFVTWVPLKEGEENEDSYGYWLMFYDFRNSTIVIPVK